MPRGNEVQGSVCGAEGTRVEDAREAAGAEDHISWDEILVGLTSSP
ncbi:hypothetical protein QK292_16455 [Arthrobacter sp. AL08]|nr:MULTISPECIES: hypothetical protein [unclassified Arthrobacter]MDI3243147.1 hypothetical protein [Arthrobacter sp. AL05]MDI3279157.1 hypothetical protein [Arthrobacter sp. AL08]